MLLKKNLKSIATDGEISAWILRSAGGCGLYAKVCLVIPVAIEGPKDYQEQDA